MSEVSWGLGDIDAGGVEGSGGRGLRWIMKLEVLNVVVMGRQGRRDK